MGPRTHGLRTPRPRHGLVALTAGLAALALAGCAPQRLLINGVADQLAAQAATSEEDLQLARDAAPFHLKLSESVLRQAPDHAALAEAVAAGFTQYSFAFVAAEAERLESRDARGALRLRQRAARLYERAQRHALAALEAREPALVRALAGPGPLPPPRPEHVGLAYWGAAAWGAAIALSTDRPEAVAELPRAVRLAQAAFAADPAHGRGSLAVLLGRFELARPGGTAATAERYFTRAEAAGAGLAALLARAESIAQPAGDREAFESLLRRALALPMPTPPTLEQQVLRERAAWLIDTVDDRF